MDSQTRVLTNGLVAAVIGALAGTAAALWSVRGWPPSVTAPAPIPIVEAVVASPAAPPTTAQAPPTSTTTATRASRQEKVTPAGAPDARELARRPDVRGLLDLREGIAQRAAARGEQDLPETRRRLDEIDRYLGEARALQLQRDAEELRKSVQLAAGPR